MFTCCTAVDPKLHYIGGWFLWRCTDNFSWFGASTRKSPFCVALHTWWARRACASAQPESNNRFCQLSAFRDRSTTKNNYLLTQLEAIQLITFWTAVKWIKLLSLVHKFKWQKVWVGLTDARECLGRGRRHSQAERWILALLLCAGFGSQIKRCVLTRCSVCTN